MSRQTPADVTEVLRELQSTGRRSEAADLLFTAVYAELRRVAQVLMARQRKDHTLQPTALIHEAYLKLVKPSQVSWQGRAHFLRAAAQAMRQLLVNHARDRAAAKRGGGRTRITLDDASGATTDRLLDVLDLNDALERLHQEDARMAQIVELRVFAGMRSREVAEVLGVSKRTVDSDWKVARLWLMDELSRAGTA